MILLFCLSILIMILCFVPKEGFYSDNNIYSAQSAIGELKTKIEGIKTMLNTIVDQDFGTMEIIAKLRPILNASKDPLYTKGVITSVQTISDKLSRLQTEAESMKSMLKNAKSFNVVIDNYLKELEDVKDLLNKIPDS